MIFVLFLPLNFDPNFPDVSRLSSLIKGKLSEGNPKLLIVTLLFAL